MSPLFRDLELIRHNPYGGGSAAEWSTAKSADIPSAFLLRLAAGPAVRFGKSRIRDISTLGLQVASDHPVQAGPEIQIRWNGRVVHGTVRYRRTQDGQFCFGIQLN